ncbi:diguanylate cyclase/phosphodiesterase (GGDEF & EAL domains) with PAS/PAC sensor(s), partial [hydrothermal vent metagenome]
MYPLGFFSKVFKIEKDNHLLCVAQYNSISLLAPLFFLIVSSSLAAIAFISMGYAPVFLTIVIPLVLLVGDLIIFNGFLIPRSDSSVAYPQLIVSRLHMTVWGVAGLGLARIFWATSLLAYADRETQELIVALLATSTLGASLCLIHLRVAALAFVAVVMVPMIAFLWLSDVAVLVILAIVLALITAVVIFVANRYGIDFARMIMQRQEMETKRAEAEHLSKLNLSIANQDSLTGLANRRAFMTHLQDLVKNGSASWEEGLAVGILDLDGFKQINDVYGHMAGDRLLQEVSKRLTSILFGKVFVARMGGDEFGIIVNDARCEKQLIVLGERICRAMQVPYKVGGFSANLGGSLGFARWDSNKDNAEELFEKADYALYHAKGNSRGG